MRVMRLSQKDFADKLGISQAYLSRVLNGKNDLTNETIDRVIDAFPNYQTIMSSNIDTIFTESDDRPTIESLEKKIKDLQRLIDTRQPLEKIPEDPNGKDLPFYDTEVFATIAPAMSDQRVMGPAHFIKIPEFNQGEFAVQVTGHSMKGYINHGDWIVAKRITNRHAIIFGEPYFVVTKSDNLKTVKFLKPGDQEGHWTLVPYNIEQFEPQELPIEEILELYRVVGLFRSL